MRSSILAALLSAAVLQLATAGLPWPKPSQQTLANTVHVMANNFTFIYDTTNDRLARAVQRYTKLIFNPVLPVSTPPAPTAALNGVKITLTSASQDLYFGVDESYGLTVPSAGGIALINATNVYGALHGLERLSQLTDWSGTGSVYIVQAGTVQDAPRFPHRGALLDTSRHFLNKQTILAFIDALAYNFMNVLHWHIVDDESFPYVSTTYPKLSEMGAYMAPSTIYTYSQADVQQVIAYAADRGIMVLPEFDTPGHTLSWGLGQPDLLTQCYGTNGKPIAGDFGPIDPTKATTWPFLQGLFEEISQVFPNSYMHLGGDEVSFDCWQSNPNIQAWMTSKGFGSNYSLLENYYEQTLVNMVSGMNKSLLVWQEIFDNGLDIPKDTIVHAWKGGSTAAGLAELQKITAAGFRGILSAGWYLNYIAYGAQWQTFYQADPQNFSGTTAQKALVVGGEFALWAEYVSDVNVISRGWPFGSAIAERLWSPASVTDLNDAANRLHVHNCRMNARGISSEPANGPSFCPYQYVPPYNPPF